MLDFDLKNHCSALIKLVNGEVYLGHTTWTSYASLLRVYKFYKFGNKVDL